MMPAISVVIPVYNAEKFLTACLDSLMAQSFRDFEAICIDDGSTDGSADILAKYAADKRFVVISQKNAGVSATRNRGIAAARGEYVHFMDADDFIDADYYEKMVAAAAGADMVASGFVSNNEYTRGITYDKNDMASGLRDKFRKTNALFDSYVWRYLFRREFLIENSLGFRTDLMSQEDTFFLLNAMKLAGRVVIVGGVLYHYIYNPGSALNSSNPAHRAKMAEQYKIGKEFRRKFACENNMANLWRFRKLNKLRIKLCRLFQ
jgi:glycosyltransferase involved in cell wall biosynthesis